MQVIRPHNYLFRGTTIGYQGNAAAVAMPYTCTSRHPVKALWFALECVSKNPASAVVYLADEYKLSALETMQIVWNPLKTRRHTALNLWIFTPYARALSILLIFRKF